MPYGLVWLLLFGCTLATASDSAAGAEDGTVFWYKTRPDDGRESLGEAPLPPYKLVQNPLARFVYSKPAWLDDPEALVRFGPTARDSGSWGITDPIELPYTRSQSLEELMA